MILQYESGNPQILGLVVGADVQRSAAILLQLWARVRPAFNRAVCSLQTLHLVRTQSLLQDQTEGQNSVVLLAESSSLMVLFVSGYWVLGWYCYFIFMSPNPYSQNSHRLTNLTYQSMVLEEEAIFMSKTQYPRPLFISVNQP